ncbi:unnamed protein product [Adineta ricciae]|uniref:Uncharacterized protein n=1 Tax=Adineta ricciae TaxID=249248 RepID=A0A816DL96_ADIRI|nr:unnamed protein product [Adineta ricciae]
MSSNDASVSFYKYPGRSFRRLDPLKSESVPQVPAGSLPPDSGRNCRGNIRSVPDRFQLEVCRRRWGNDWNLRLNFRPESGGKEMICQQFQNVKQELQSIKAELKKATGSSTPPGETVTQVNKSDAGSDRILPDPTI